MKGQMSIYDFPECLPEKKKVLQQLKDGDCKYSFHSCNKEELWKVADSLDGINCWKMCCRKCRVRYCGARCNGSEEPSGCYLCFHEDNGKCYASNSEHYEKLVPSMPCSYYDGC